MLARAISKNKISSRASERRGEQQTGVIKLLGILCRDKRSPLDSDGDRRY